jgi:ATP-dependent DNA helicase RecQ
VPKNLEGYYQQTGRAGRDGDQGRCILFWRQGDFAQQQFFVNNPTGAGAGAGAGSGSGAAGGAGGGGGGGGYSAMDGLVAMQRFCATNTGRRRQLLDYFGERDAGGFRCEGCDVCAAAAADAAAAASGAGPPAEVDFGPDCRLALVALAFCRGYGVSAAK